MKRRFLAVLLTVMMVSTMFAGFTVSVSAANETPVRTYLDMDMENWTSGTDRLNADGSAIASTLKDTTYITGVFDVNPGSIESQSVAADSVTGSQVWQIVRKADGVERSRIRFNIDDGSFASNVFWTEFSVKYEGAFARISFEHDNAKSTMFIDNNGILRTGLSNSWQNDEDWKTAAVLCNDALELGKWYHIALAIDNSSSSRPMYLWINGKKVVNGTVSSSSGAGLNYLDFNITYPTEKATISIDNFRLYTTAALDTHPENGVVADANGSDEISIANESLVTGLSAKTVNEVKSAFTYGDKLVFVKNGEILEGDEQVAGSVAYAPLSNGKGFRAYDVVRYIPQDIITSTSATDITASIGTANAAHPVRGMVNDAMSADADIYKANCTDTTTPLVVTISLDAYYELQYLKVYERHLGGQRRVTVELGKNGEYTTVATNAPLATAYSINPGYIGVGTVPFTETIEKANSIRLTFTADSGNGGEKTYEIWEIEAYGAKTGDLPKDILAPIGTEGSAVSSISASIETANSTYHPVANLVDGNMSSDYYYKSKANVTDDLEIVINLDAFYTLSKINIFERKMNSTDISVKVELGYKGDYKTVADGTALVAQTYIEFHETLADTIRFTFDYASGGEVSKYQIWEIEAYGEKTEDFPAYSDIIAPVGEGSAVASVTTNIPQRTNSNDVAKLTDGVKSYDEGEPYKSTKDFESAPLKVLITFDAIYELTSVNVYERQIGIDTKVDVAVGKDGVFTTIANDVQLTASTISTQTGLTEIKIPFRQADAILFTFENTDGYDANESLYQILELEAYGGKVADVTKSAVLPAYSFGELTNNSFIVAISTPVAISGEMVVAAYEEDELVALTEAREVEFGKGVTAEYTFSSDGIIKDGREYKVFVWDSIENALQKPLFKSEIIVK